MSTEIKTAAAKNVQPPAEIRYFRFGSGKETMVILPGLSLKSVMDSAEFIASSYSIFADRFTIYVFDNREVIPPGSTPETFAADTVGAMDSLGLDGVYLFGVSLGGITAQIIAAKYPGYVKKLVLASTADELTEKSEDGLKKWIEYAKNGEAGKLVMDFAEAVYSDELLTRSRGAFVQLAKMVTDDDLDRFIATASGLIGFSTFPYLKDIKCPVFVIGGAMDKLTPADGMSFLAKETGAKLFLYDDGTHSVYDEKPDFRQKVLDFFKGD